MPPPHLMWQRELNPHLPVEAVQLLFVATGVSRLGGFLLSFLLFLPKAGVQ